MLEIKVMTQLSQKYLFGTDKFTEMRHTTQINIKVLLKECHEYYE